MKERNKLKKNKPKKNLRHEWITIKSLDKMPVINHISESVIFGIVILILLVSSIIGLNRTGQIEWEITCFVLIPFFLIVLLLFIFEWIRAYNKLNNIKNSHMVLKIERIVIIVFFVYICILFSPLIVYNIVSENKSYRILNTIIKIIKAIIILFIASLVLLLIACVIDKLIGISNFIELIYKFKMTFLNSINFVHFLTFMITNIILIIIIIIVAKVQKNEIINSVKLISIPSLIFMIVLLIIKYNFSHALLITMLETKYSLNELLGIYSFLFAIIGFLPQK